ncbi:MAG: hypothetical protein J0M15_09550 [Deltaproteobacteria bacterium]|nr:hypothetical protein [Deltaproteobacteria bacterium]
MSKQKQIVKSFFALTLFAASKMKGILFVFTFLFIVHSKGTDFGDKGCNVVLLEAGNYKTGGWGNYYGASVAVSKSIISQYNDPKVFLYYGTDKIEKPINSKDNGNYKVYYFKLSSGATHYSQSMNMIPFIAYSTDRLFDNNFGIGEVILKGSNNWRFIQNKCKIN